MFRASEEKQPLLGDEQASSFYTTEKAVKTVKLDPSSIPRGQGQPPPKEMWLEYRLWTSYYEFATRPKPAGPITTRIFQSDVVSYLSNTMSSSRKPSAKRPPWKVYYLEFRWRDARGQRVGLYAITRANLIKAWTKLLEGYEVPATAYDNIARELRQADWTTLKHGDLSQDDYDAAFALCTRLQEIAEARKALPLILAEQMQFLFLCENDGIVPQYWETYPDFVDPITFDSITPVKYKETGENRYRLKAAPSSPRGQPMFADYLFRVADFVFENDLPPEPGVDMEHLLTKAHRLLWNLQYRRFRAEMKEQECVIC